MNDDSGIQISDNSQVEDAAIGAQYRAIANETTPRHLDNAVLDNARQAAGRRFSLFGPAGWYRPAAFAATLVLGAGILLQLADSGILQPVAPDASSAVPGTEPGSAPARSFPDEAESEAAQIRALTGLDNATGSAPADAGVMAPPQPLPATVAGDSDGCSDEQKSTAGSWWQCIRALEGQGLPQVAERELSQLLQNYPQFVLPPRP